MSKRFETQVKHHPDVRGDQWWASLSVIEDVDSLDIVSCSGATREEAILKLYAELNQSTGKMIKAVCSLIPSVTCKEDGK